MSYPTVPKVLSAGVVNGAQNLLDSGLPTITVSGGYAVLGTANNYPQGRITNTYELFDNMSWVSPLGASKHSFLWGFHIRREEARRLAPSRHDRYGHVHVADTRHVPFGQEGERGGRMGC